MNTYLYEESSDEQAEKARLLLALWTDLYPLSLKAWLLQREDQFVGDAAKCDTCPVQRYLSDQPSYAHYALEIGYGGLNFVRFAEDGYEQYCLVVSRQLLPD